MFDRKLSFNVDEKEKINYIDWVEACSEGQSSFKPKLLVFTDKGVHCFRGSGSKPCSVCPIENLCPDGPKPEYKFRYDRITEIITFPHIP